MTLLNRLLISTTIVTGLFLAGWPQPVAAQQQITCQSNNNAYQFCNTSPHNGVRLIRQLSNTACILNQTWGYRSNGIWVNNGCRATFQLVQSGGYRPSYGQTQVRQGVTASDYPRYYNNNDDVSVGAAIGAIAAVGIAAAILSDNDGGSSDGNTITCSSSGNSYQYCPANTRNGVTLKRQISSAGCWYQNSWGYDDGGIWVDNGCRAEFTLR